MLHSAAMQIFLTALPSFKKVTLTTNGWRPCKMMDKSLNIAEVDKRYFTQLGTSLLLMVGRVITVNNTTRIF